MKKILITFGDQKYYRSMELLSSSALSKGKVEEVKSYKKEDLQSSEFWIKNQYILSQPRGAGYWIWKPYIILDAFNELENGDVVLYSDAGLSVIGDLTPLFEIASGETNGGKIMFRLPWVGAKHIAKIWTKRDCFVIMNCDEEKYWNAAMSNGAVSLWKKSPENIEFLKEWLKYLRDPRIVTDEPNIAGKPNFMEFRDHRHDQSVLSLLAIKYGFEMFRDPTQWGNSEKGLFTNSPYDQLFDHHRKSD